ncbi:MAG: hypothetical protein ACI80F_002237, partial [Natronomonas sp.]
RAAVVVARYGDSLVSRLAPLAVRLFEAFASLTPRYRSSPGTALASLARTFTFASTTCRSAELLR